MSNLSKIFISTILLIFLFLGCTKKTESDLIVACNLPLTGDLATYGEAVRDGASFALDELTKEIENKNIKIKFDWQDNAGQPKNAVSIVKNQYLKKIDIYISGVKPQTMSIIDEISKKGTPHFVWIFDAFVCRDYKNTFRTWVSYKYEPDYFIKYINKVKPQKVAIIYVNLPHAEQEFKEILIPQINNLRINDIFIESYNWTKKDYKDIASKVSKFNPDLIILNGFKATIIGLIQSLKSVNLIKDGNTIVTYDMLDAAEELAADVIEGIRVVAPTFNTRPDEREIKQWKEKFEERYNRKPRYTDAYAYDMAKIIISTASKISFPTKPDEIAQVILDTQIEGITGPLKFDKDGDLVISLEIGVYKNGKLLPDEI